MLFIRADSNPVIAGGHIMRCLAIASACNEIGEKVCFLIADDNPVSVLEEAGMPYHILNSDWRDLMTDLNQVKDIIRKEKNAYLLIDTYRITREYVEKIKPLCKVAYLGSKQEYLGKLDCLINYSSEIDREFYLSHYDKETKLLLGVSYAPLRKEFQSVKKIHKDRIERILITTGNTDRNNMVCKLLSVLIPLIGEITIDVVIGRMFENKQKIYDKYSQYPNVILHQGVKSMSSLMRKCDLAISANGTTIYELSAMGLPTISFALVEEQVKSAESLSNLGVVDYCGTTFREQTKCIIRIRNRVEYYLFHNDELLSLAERAHQLIDGNGSYKIIKELFD